MFIELTNKQTGGLTLFDISNRIFILDNGAETPAVWTDHKMATHYYFKETYGQVKEKLIKSGLLKE